MSRIVWVESSERSDDSNRKKEVQRFDTRGKGREGKGRRRKREKKDTTADHHLTTYEYEGVWCCLVGSSYGLISLLSFSLFLSFLFGVRSFVSLSFVVFEVVGRKTTNYILYSHTL